MADSWSSTNVLDKQLEKKVLDWYAEVMKYGDCIKVMNHLVECH